MTGLNSYKKKEKFEDDLSMGVILYKICNQCEGHRSLAKGDPPTLFQLLTNVIENPPPPIFGKYH